MDRSFRFSIRHILVATAVAALALGWLVDHGRLSIELDRYRASNSALSQQLSDLARQLADLKQERALELFKLRAVPPTSSDSP